MLTPNFMPCEPISLVSLSLNCSESLWAYTFGGRDQRLPIWPVSCTQP
jgi:hypothetical protein